MIPIVIIVIIAAALGSVFLIANRQRAATGNLSRETVKRDASAAEGDDGVFLTFDGVEGLPPSVDFEDSTPNV